MSDIIIKDSKIHGKGIFANREFKKGEIVIKYDTSDTISEEELKKVPDNKKENVGVSKDGKLFFQKAPAKYVNHSCDANTTSEDDCDVAIRDIKKGEEITSDYSKDSPPGFNMKCECGSKNCRRIIK